MNEQPTISKATLRGSLLFASALAIIFVLPDLYYYFQPDETVHIRYYNSEFSHAVTNVRKNYRRRSYDRRLTKRYSPPPVAFDPNTYTQEDWMRLGLSEKQAAVVLKFTRYGIRSNDDLRKIVVIPEALYELIKDSTRYPARQMAYTSARPEKQEQQPVIRKTDVNSATEEQLLAVRGLGPFFVRQILRKRDELGGFYTPEQLLEVWKMDQEKLAAILPYLEFNPSGIRKLNINTATADELKAHPYISWNLANSIVKLRSQTGGYQRIEDVRKSVLMTDELYEKLKRYFTVDE